MTEPISVNICEENCVEIFHKCVTIMGKQNLHFCKLYQIHCIQKQNNLCEQKNQQYNSHKKKSLHIPITPPNTKKV